MTDYAEKTETAKVSFAPLTVETINEVFMILEIRNLRGPIERIALVQMMECLRDTKIIKNPSLTIYSEELTSDVGYQLAGAVYRPRYCDAMPSFPIFYEYWPCAWGTYEDFKEKTFVFNPNFIEEVTSMDEEDFYQLCDKLLKPVDRCLWDTENGLFEVLS